MDASASIEHEPSLEDRPDIAEQLDELYAEIEAESDSGDVEEASEEFVKMSGGEMLEQIDDINEGTISFLEEKIKEAPNRKERKRAKLQLDIYEDTLELLEDIEDWVDEEKPKKVQEKTMKYLDKVMKRMRKAGLDDEEILNAADELQDFINANTQAYEETIGKPHLILEGTSVLLELIPLVSGPKMLAESVIGKTMAGRKLSIPGRFWHATWAGIWTVVDTAGLAVGILAAPETAGLGTVAVEGAVLAAKGAKVTKAMKVGAALMRMAKGGGKASKAILKTSKFLVKHPKLAKGAVRVGKHGGKLSKLNTVKGAVKIAAKTPKAVARMRIFKNVRAERLELLSTLDSVFKSAS